VEWCARSLAPACIASDHPAGRRARIAQFERRSEDYLTFPPAVPVPGTLREASQVPRDPLVLTANVGSVLEFNATNIFTNTSGCVGRKHAATKRLTGRPRRRMQIAYCGDGRHCVHRHLR
jgi:hypothetical protein